MSVTALILAGGRATRMGGADKGLVLFNNKPLIAHVIERLQTQVDEIIINANRELETYRALGYQVLADEIADFAGPLAGMHLGLKHTTSEYLLTAPCDCPLLPANLCEKLLAALNTQHADIAIATSHGSDHPVICLCKKSALASLNSYLQQSGRKVGAWQKSLNHVYVDFSATPDVFSNINTPDELNLLVSTLNHG